MTGIKTETLDRLFGKCISEEEGPNKSLFQPCFTKQPSEEEALMIEVLSLKIRSFIIFTHLSKVKAKTTFLRHPLLQTYTKLWVSEKRTTLGE